jgi:hypothetical protein
MTKCKAHERLHTITSEEQEESKSTPSFIKHVLDEAAIEEKVREFFRGQAVGAHTQTHFRVVEELAPGQPLPQQVSKRRKWKVDKAI